MTDVHREASSLVHSHSTAALRDIDAIVDSNGADGLLSLLQAQLLAIKISEIFTMAWSL